MNEDRIWELVNREVDQELSETERRELEDDLEKHPEWVVRRTEVRKLSRVLDDFQEVSAPEDMKANIMQALPARSRPRPQQVIRLDSRPGNLWSKLGLRYAYAFAGGAVVGAALLALVFRMAPDSFPVKGDLTGTIMFRNLPAEFTAVDRGEIDTPEVAGSLEIAASEDLVAAQIELESDRPVELVVGFAPDQMAMTGFTYREGNGAPLTIGHDEIRLNHIGSNQYNLVWSRIGKQSISVRVTLTADDLIYEQNLTIPSLDQ